MLIQVLNFLVDKSNIRECTYLLELKRMLEHTSFGSRLKELRTRAALSREQLAQIVATFGFDVTISARTIEGLEQGRYKDPGWLSVQLLARALGVTPDAFMLAPASIAPTPRGRPMKMDILSCLENWSDRNLRWLIDHLARRNEQGGRLTYAVIERKACELRDKRKSAGEFVSENNPAGSRYVLVGIEQHEFGRFKRPFDCEELAATMGLAVNERLEYFGHAIVRKAPA